MRRRWTKEEMALTLDETKSNEEVSELTGRSIEAIRAKRQKLCSRKSFSKHFWTKAEDDLIREGELSNREIASRTQFSEEQVANRRKMLAKTTRGYRPWTSEEESIIMDSDKSDAELARELNRTRQAIEKRRQYLRRGKPAMEYDAVHESRRKRCYLYPPRPWTQAEDALVIAHEIPDEELSSQIERSIAAIVTRRKNLRKMFPDSV